MELEFRYTLSIGTFVLGFLIFFIGWRRSKMYDDLNPRDKRDFLIGFFAIMILNAFLYPLSLALRGDSTSQETRATVSLALPWVVNLALLIFFAFYRRQIALGASALLGSLLPFVVLARLLRIVSFLVLASTMRGFSGLEATIVFWMSAAILGVLIFLFWLKTKVLKDLNPFDQRDFLIGFFGIMILNALLCPLSLALRGGSTPPETRATISLALPWVVNLALLIFFAFYRRQIALGALTLVGFLLASVVLLGILFFASCFVLCGAAALFDSWFEGY
jgi:hypothetical protein